MPKADIKRLIEAKRLEVERLRDAMHNAPMNKVFQDHTGHKFLGTHSMAWADRSREWGVAKNELTAILKEIEE